MNFCKISLLASLFAGLTSASALAQDSENLIFNAITSNTSNFDSQSEFYNVWRVSDSDGNRLTDSQQPLAYFTGYLSGSRINYDGSVLTTYNDFSNLIADNQPLAVLTYPTNSTSLDTNYNLPIAISGEGDYLLSGVVGIAKHATKIPTTTTVNDCCCMVVTADATPGKKNMEFVQQEDGLYTIKVTEQNGENAVYGFSWLSDLATKYQQAIAFEYTLHLTPEHKYLSFYMPSYLMALGNLKLEIKTATSVISVQTPDDDNAKTVYYDLQGRKLSNTDSLLPGFYIRKCGSKTEKLYIK
jgi:hypothetical protein